MAQGWTITGGAGDATINSSGVATFPKNTGTSEITYTITYEDANGCTASTSYTIPTGSSCNCNCDMFVMDTSDMSFAVTGGTNTRTITSYCGVITVSSNKTWATVSVSNGVISVTATDYSGGDDPREATITVKQDDKCDKTFRVGQSAYECERKDRMMSVELAGIEFTYSNEPALSVTSIVAIHGTDALCNQSPEDITFSVDFTKHGDDIHNNYEVNYNSYTAYGQEIDSNMRNITYDFTIPNVNVSKTGSPLISTLVSDNLDIFYGVGPVGYKYQVVMDRINVDNQGDHIEIEYQSRNTYNQNKRLLATVYLGLGRLGSVFNVVLENTDYLPA